MKLLQITRDAILSPLQSVSGVVEKRHTLPILSNILIQQKQDHISLVATDLEIQMSTKITSETKGPDEIGLTVSARKLQEILRALPEGTEVILDVQNNRLQLRAGRSRFNLQTLPASDFPTLADPGATLARIVLRQRELHELLLLVQYAMAQQDIRYYLNGLLLVLDIEQLRVIATDGHRLSYAVGSITKQEEKREVILPRKAVIELAKQLAESDDEVEIELYAAQVKFRFSTIELITKTIDGKFPDYTRVIPTNYHKQISLDRSSLLQSLQRVGILSNEKFRGVRWVLGTNILRISCTNNEQEEALEELEVSYAGDELDMGFNINYLFDVLTNVQSETVICAFEDANSSMLVSVPTKPDFRYVVMPMRI
jgi:DNA polymerase-3 subunit beta